MTANKEMRYWQTQEEWYVHDEATNTFTLKEGAPERVKNSYQMWVDYYDGRLG